MKYLLALLLGILTGGLLAIAIVVFNPLAAAPVLSPVEASGNDLIVLNYSGVAEDALVHTNDGESSVKPQPARVQQLWEPAVRQTDLTVTLLSDARNEPAGLGIKFASWSESTKLLSGQVMVDSLWYVYMPERGSFVVGQQENRFEYFRDIVLPAHWSSSDSWKGQWRGNLTSGPGSLGTGVVAGGSGEFADLRSAAIETLTARAYSTESGPVAAEGQLTIELPGEPATDLADTASPADASAPVAATETP
ncbi:MAG: hypothetical protein AAGE85_14640 [Pseudomonadota bacterium]